MVGILDREKMCREGRKGKKVIISEMQEQGEKSEGRIRGDISLRSGEKILL